MILLYKNVLVLQNRPVTRQVQFTYFATWWFSLDRGLSVGDLVEWQWMCSSIIICDSIAWYDVPIRCVTNLHGVSFWFISTQSLWWLVFKRWCCVLLSMRYVSRSDSTRMLHHFPHTLHHQRHTSKPVLQYSNYLHFCISARYTYFVYITM